MKSLLSIYGMLFKISRSSQKCFFIFLVGLIFIAAWGESHLVLAVHDFVAVISKTSLDDGDLLTDQLITIGALIIVVNIARVVINIGNAYFSAAMGGKIASVYYDRTIKFEGSPETLKISAEVSNLTTKIISIIANAITPLLNLVVAVVTTLFVFSALADINLVSTAAVTVGLLSVYLSIYFVCRKTLTRSSSVVDRLIWRQTQHVQETIANWRTIKIDKVEKILSEEFSASEHQLRKKQAAIVSISIAPRYVVEAAAVVVVGVIALFALKNPHLMSFDFSIIAATAVAGQRILPVAQQAFFGLARGLGESQIIPRYCFDLSEARLPNNSEPNKISVNRAGPRINTIKLDNVALSWRGRTQVSGIDFEINHLEHTIITGPSGSGKSTLMNAILGFVKPSSGLILLDGVSLDEKKMPVWHNRIALVPQKIMMFDRTILENMKISNWHQQLSDTEIEKEIWQALNYVGIDKVVESMPKKLHTDIGEYGAEISGGQLQRLSIAKALLKKPDFLFLDEATAGLDARSEVELIDKIISQNITTLICISHSNNVSGLFKQNITL